MNEIATLTIKFPAGKVGSELLHYMGADDERHLKERSLIAQELVNKCYIGKKCELNKAELDQLIKEVENTVDIKSDKVGEDNREWSGLDQYRLTRFGDKLKIMRTTFFP